MKLSKPLKIVIGIGTAITTLWPFVLPVLWLLFIFTIPFFDFESSQSFPLPFAIFALGFPLIMVASFIQIALQVFYWSHIILNKDASDATRIVFGVGSFIFPWLAMPIYFFMHVLPNKEEGPAPAPA
jgi:hypothetical protein